MADLTIFLILTIISIAGFAASVWLKRPEFFVLSGFLLISMSFIFYGEGIEKNTGKDINTIDANYQKETLKFTALTPVNDSSVNVLALLTLYTGFVFVVFGLLAMILE